MVGILANKMCGVRELKRSISHFSTISLPFKSINLNTGKHTNFELGTRVPMIIRSPGIEPTTVDALVESVDLYPTIAALAQLDKPQDLDGMNLEPLMTKQVDTLKDAVFSEYPRCPTNLTEPWSDRTSCVRRKISNHKKIRINTHSNTLYIRTQVQTERENFTVMGYSVRTCAFMFYIFVAMNLTHFFFSFRHVRLAIHRMASMGRRTSCWGFQSYCG